MRTLTLTALLALSTLAAAQPKKLQLLALGAASGVTLRLPLPEQGLPEAGFRVTREGPGGPKTFTVRPLNRADAVARFKVDPEEYTQALDALRAARTASAQQRGMLLLGAFGALTEGRYARALGFLVDDAGLAPGAYTYTVAADGETFRTTVTVGRDTPLSAPVGLKTSVAPGQVKLTWTRGDATVLGYKVQRSTGAAGFADLQARPRIVNRGETPAHEDTRFDPKQSLRYRVVAFDVFGRESAPSAPVTVEARATEPLPSPELAKVEGAQGEVRLAWAKVTDPRVTGIEVLRGDKPGKLSVLTRLPAAATSFADKSAAPGRHHSYALRVTDGRNVGPRSEDRSGRAYNATPPSAPRAVKATGEEDALVLSWTANPEKDVAGYNVYRAELGWQDEVRFTLLNGAPLKAMSFRDAVPQGVQSTFRYVVRAVNTSGVLGAASEAAQAALIDKTAPDAPLLVRAEAGRGKIALVFTQAPTPDLKAFEVYRAADDEAEPRKVATLPADSVAFVDADVRPGERYSYAVRAVDASGNASEASNVKAATTAAAKLAAPQDLRAMRADGKTRLSWAKAPGAMGYVVYREANGKRVQVAGPLEATTFEEAAAGRATYLVRAVGPDGEAGPFSKPATP